MPTQASNATMPVTTYSVVRCARLRMGKEGTMWIGVPTVGTVTSRLLPGKGVLHLGTRSAGRGIPLLRKSWPTHACCPGMPGLPDGCGDCSRVVEPEAQLDPDLV